jgi:hypothetical protein
MPFQRLKLKFEKLLSNLCFQIQLAPLQRGSGDVPGAAEADERQGLTLVHFSARRKCFCGMGCVFRGCLGVAV